ncbi:hypothetical protein MGYG_03544 [Nannizzia gypsea CBS 118893]|uniref:Coatomer subunit epsilon n=1 Tax=Arthroderma gypseum (strain ATCC MYA-4604 / CBS 118893) TaxID=535722 RepID=E4USH3_ARTGP|nr:hypothetical protein MGYG_03544 [Nannizzia gypsea CBS 118893]EFR00540.1 hypothetical protein MGYG_03544 [Nannizzia gypsea CBS 118893]
MDPFSAEGELLNIHNAFYQGQYQEVVDFDTSSFSSENTLAARILKLRAQIALGQSKEVLKLLGAKRDTPELDAVAALAQHVSGDEEGALKLAESLAAKHEDNAAVQVLDCGGTRSVIEAFWKSRGVGSSSSSSFACDMSIWLTTQLDSVALIVQIHLQQNRSDLALKEVQAARRWAQDSLLVNLAESWVGMRVGGEKYQAAFYVYEELASVPSTTSALSMVGQSVSELHLGRLPEAEAALQSALQKYPEDPQVLANSIVLNTINGKDKEELIGKLSKIQPDHPLLTDLEEKSALFDTAAAKYSVKA